MTISATNEPTMVCIRRAAVRGLTLIELVIGLAIAAMAMAVAVGAINSLTDAALRSTAVELSGAIKTAYDRAIMQRRTERMSIDLDKGLWWLDYTEEPFTLSSEKDALTLAKSLGKPADEPSKKDPPTKAKEGAPSLFSTKSIFSDSTKDAVSTYSAANVSEEQKRAEVKRAIEGGRAIDFKPDVDISKPKPFPRSVRVTRVWAGHQTEPVTAGIARIHFFNAGWSDPAQIELSDGEDFITLKVYPLTGRVRTYDKQLEIKPEREDESTRQDEQL